MKLQDVNHFLLSPSSVRMVFQAWLDGFCANQSRAIVTDVAQRSDGSVRVVVKAAEGPGLERGSLQNLFDPANPDDLKEFVEGVASVRADTEREAQNVEDLTNKIRGRNKKKGDDKS